MKQQARRRKGTGSIFKRSNGTYVYQYTEIGGHLKTVSLRNEHGEAITRRPDAEKEAQRLGDERQKLEALESKGEYLSKVAQIKQLVIQTKVSLDSLWNYYLNMPNRPDSGAITLSGYERSLKRFLAFCTQNRLASLSEISTDIAGQYMVSLWDQGVAPRTYNKHLQVLKLVFKVVLGEDSPFTILKPKLLEQESRKPFTAEQINRIFQTLEDPQFYLLHKTEMRIMIMLGLAFGLRLHDAACFQWSFIHHDVVQFKPAKTKRRQHEPLLLPIPPILQTEFKLAAQWREDDFVLPHVARRYQTNDSGISQDISRLLEAAGIQTKEVASTDIRRQYYTNRQGITCQRHIGRYSFHSFRHTFCSLAANAGKDLSLIRSIVGHADVKMTEHYTHFDLESKRSLINSLPLPSIHAVGIPVKNDGSNSVMQKVSLASYIQSLPSFELKNLCLWLEANLSSMQRRELLAFLQK